ncbi:hypothetical protein APSETT444_007930 [Aspergillus pseudonomiae]
MGKLKDYITTDRSGITENRHQVHAAIVSADGKLLYSVGDPSRITLLRSAAKPAQALAVVSTGALEKFNFDEADLALMCASHNSEDRHLSRARDMLRKVSAEEKDLRCGGHAALSETVNREWIRRDYTPTAITNNCSGKHAGMLGGARALGAEIRDYHLPCNPLQRRVREVVEELAGLETAPDGVLWGIDGCNLPAPAFPLQNMAKFYAVFAEAAGAVEDAGSASGKERDMARIFNAMTRYPELVGGEGRFCTVLMRVFRGTLIGKVGADGCYGIGIQASEYTRRLGADGAVGLAVKIEDGNREILYSAVVELLDQLDIGTPDMRRELASFHHPEIVNTAGVVTGSTAHHFHLNYGFGY